MRLEMLSDPLTQLEIAGAGSAFSVAAAAATALVSAFVASWARRASARARAAAPASLRTSGWQRV